MIMFSFLISFVCGIAFINASPANSNIDYTLDYVVDSPLDSPLAYTYGRRTPQGIFFNTTEDYRKHCALNAIEYNDAHPGIGYRVSLTKAAHENGAVCLDGSVPNYYYRPGWGDGVTKFMVFMQGGGWCSGIDDSIAACTQTCISRSGGALGSSKADTPYLSFDGSYYSTSQAYNPLAYNWNTVYGRYCDGFSRSGNNETVFVDPQSGKSLYFRGFRILSAMFQHLVDNYEFASATDVIFSGCSAGGLTVWLHTDYVRNAFVPKNARYMAIPDSGFFMQYNGAGGFVDAMQWIWDWANVSAAMNQGCMEAHAKTKDEYQCIFAQNTAPFVQSKTFPLQSRFDAWQINEELRSSNATLVNEYGLNLTNAFLNGYANGGGFSAAHGAFLDSCEHHCGEWQHIIIDGDTQAPAETNWYYANNTHNKVWFQNETFPCAECCS